MKDVDAHFQNLVGQVPVPIWIADAGRQWIFVNQAWCDLTGQAAEDALGNGWQDAVHIDDRKRVQSEMAIAFEERRSLSVEFRIPIAADEYRWGRLVGNPRSSQAGDFEGFAGSCVDIHTERTHSEQQLVEVSRSHLEEFCTRAPAMMHSIDAQGVIVSVSDDWLDHFGYRRDEVIGRKRTDFMPSEMRPLAEKRLSQFLIDGLCDNVEFQFAMKSGEVRDMRLSAIAERDEQGKFVQSIAVLEDVTEAKRTLRHLRQTQRAFDQSSEMILWLNLDGKILDVNQRACEALEYTADELTSMFIFEIDSHLSAERWAEIPLEEELEKGRILRSELKSKQGRANSDRGQLQNRQRRRRQVYLCLHP